MISRHHSERVHPVNSGRASTWSIRAASASETFSPMGTRAESGSLVRAMCSRYPEQAGWNGASGRGPLPQTGALSPRRGLPDGPTFSTPAGGMPGYLSRPGSDDRWLGMVVLHDGFGIDEAVRAQPDWLSGAGYLALSVDLGLRAAISVPAEDVP